MISQSKRWQKVAAPKKRAVQKKFQFKRVEDNYSLEIMRDIHLFLEYCTKKGEDLPDLLLFEGDGRRLVRKLNRETLKHILKINEITKKYKTNVKQNVCKILKAA